MYIDITLPFSDDIFADEVPQMVDYQSSETIPAYLLDMPEEENATYYNIYDYLGAPSVEISTEPQTLIEVCANALTGKKSFLDKTDFQRETGLGSEIHRFNPLFTKQNGLTVWEAAEYIAGSFSDTGLIPFDEVGSYDIQEVRNTIIELFQICANPSDFANFTKNANQKRAKDFEQQFYTTG